MSCICDVQTLKNPWNFIPAVLWGKRFVRSTFGIHYTESESILYLYYLDNNAPVYFWSKSFEPKKHEKDALIYKLVLFDLIKIIQMI